MWYLVVYYIKTITLNEINYGIKSKELLVIINTFNKWTVKLIYLFKFKVVID